MICRDMDERQQGKAIPLRGSPGPGGMGSRDGVWARLGDLQGRKALRIGLVSDTHVFPTAPGLPPPVLAALEGVDVILHAGDIYDLTVLDELEQVAPVLAARGNGDGLLPEDPRLAERHLFTLGGLRVGLVHYFPFPEFSLERAFKLSLGAEVDIVVCGDTHVPMVARDGGVLIVNPGSPTYPFNLQRQLGTLGILNVADGLTTASILQLGDSSNLRLFLRSAFPGPQAAHLVDVTHLAADSAES